MTIPVRGKTLSALKFVFALVSFLTNTHINFTCDIKNISKITSLRRDVPRGRPPVYRFNNFHPGSKNSFAVYNGMTLHEVASFKTAVNTFKSGIDFIQWLCGGSFTWSKSLMETNILLFHELLGMEERGDALPCSRTPSNPCGAWYVKIHPSAPGVHINMLPDGDPVPVSATIAQKSVSEG